MLDEEVMPFSSLERAAVSKRDLVSESFKIKTTKLFEKITFALIPALSIVSNNSLTTYLLYSLTDI
ncbi:hypothetical protein AXF42_Ash020204 [Apostasia shenzhenica]|uniref:Uncharacterized protein n=1 Tax=Apostasia shenzhenica TaxID=1088818 RepID=A0A2H9ZWW9_9ASPA|nr:hypothetical protein AXF42_Ash020204 [Apostasia shenzhenica]